MLIKKEKIEDLEFMDVEPEDEELRAIVMEDEDNAKKKAEEEYYKNVKRVEKLKLEEAMKRGEIFADSIGERNYLVGLRKRKCHF
ncbi:MAG: hypothetical protein KA015_05240 [Spirochaetes bacterium]|nr:hypothetical protein [Spirochaetota bacterium]